MLAERVKTWTEEWKQQGLEQGLEQGRQEGRREAHEEGVQFGESMLLRRQLRRRFGPLPDWVNERLASACQADLEHWADRVLDSTTLEMVFARD